MAEPNTHFMTMISLARMGLKIVPSLMEHKTKGHGAFCIDGDGFVFKPFNGSGDISITWEEFDKGCQRQK